MLISLLQYWTNIFNLYCSSMLEYKSTSRVCSSCIEISCQSDIVPSTLSPRCSQQFSQQPERQIWQISIYGTCVAVACLIRSKQAFICSPISVSPQHKFQVGNWFLSELKGLQPFHCLSSYVCVRVCVCGCMCMCLCPLKCVWMGWVCVSVCVCWCYLCNWI